MMVSSQALGLFSLLCFVLAQQNLVRNPSFEDLNATSNQPEHWQTHFFEFPTTWISPDDTLNFTAGLEVRNNATDAQDGVRHVAMWDCVEFWQDEILVQPGGTYQLSYWANHNASAIPTPQLDYIHGISWAGASPNPIIHVGDSGWQQISLTGIINTTTTRIFFLWAQKAAELRIDNVSLKLVAGPPEDNAVPINLLQNGGFEDSESDVAPWECDSVCSIYTPTGVYYPPEGLNQLHFSPVSSLSAGTLTQKTKSVFNTTYDISFLAHTTGVETDSDLRVALGNDSQLFKISPGAEYTGPFGSFKASLVATGDDDDMVFTFNTPNAFLRLDDVRMYKSNAPRAPTLDPLGNNSGKKSSKGPVIGGAVGGVLGALVIGIIVFFVFRRRQQRTDKNKMMDATILREEFEKFTSNSTVAGSPSPFMSSEHSYPSYGGTVPSMPRFSNVPELQTTTPRPPTGMSVNNPHLPDTYSRWDHSPSPFHPVPNSARTTSQSAGDAQSVWSHATR